MSSATAHSLPPRATFVLIRYVWILLAIILLVPVGIASWFYLAAHSALPKLDGTIKVSGLIAPVEVTRDAQGVPHIRAANMHDLLFAQGYVTDQARLWQLDM